MPYALVTDVRAIVDTDLTDVEITNLITWADDWVNKKIDAGAATAAFLEQLSATYTAYMCMRKDPDAMKLGELSTDRGIMIKLLRDDLMDLVAMGGGGMSFTPAVEPLG